MSLPLLKVSLRMLLDLVKMLDANETDYKVGCKCKNEEAANGLARQLDNMLRDYLELRVKIEEDGVSVVIVPAAENAPEK
jgi:hypothetical protein